MKIRVFIADDHGVLRGGLRVLINDQPDMEVVGEAVDGVNAERGILETRPDVALIDISMPGGGGLEAIGAVKRRLPVTRVIVLTFHDEPGYVRAALAAGASGFVVKRVVDTELLAAIRAVARGRTFMDVSFQTREVALRENRSSPARSVGLISGREREVLGLVAEGYTNREIADALSLSVKSVETYRGRVMEKLGLSTRAALVRFALECGFLAPGKSAG
jgi:two-component system, NarL family, response regulator NreC